MTEASLVQIVTVSSGALVSLFAMQRQKYRLDIKALDKKHADELTIVDEKKKLAHAMVVSNQSALNKFDRSKDDLLSRVSGLEEAISKLQSAVEYLQNAFPTFMDLMSKVNHHFEVRQPTQPSQLKELAPDVVRVEQKGDPT